MTNYFEGEKKYMSPLIEEYGVWSVNNMDKEDLEHAIYEQLLLFDLEFKVEAISVNDFLSSLREEDCIAVYLDNIDPHLPEHKQKYFRTQAKKLGIERYLDIKMRIVSYIEKMIHDRKIFYADVLNLSAMERKISLYNDLNLSDDAKKSIRQMVMDTIGTWWEGYTIPEGEDVISLVEFRETCSNNISAGSSLEDVAAIMEYELTHGSIDDKIIN